MTGVYLDELNSAHKCIKIRDKSHVFLSQIKQTQDEEKKQLTALRDLIKSSLQLDQKEVGGLDVSSRVSSVSEVAWDGLFGFPDLQNRHVGSLLPPWLWGHMR